MKQPLIFKSLLYGRALSETKGRLTQIANIHPTAGNLATYDYGYDVDHYTAQSTMLGQRSSMNATVPVQSFNNHQFKYYYDSNYQLNRADYPNVAPFNAEVDSWTYDAIGNRLTNTVNGNTQNYTYFKNGSNPLNGQRLQSDSVNTYAYDNNGNTTSRTGYTFTWDYEDRMTAISGGVTASYTYDYMGRRTSKTVGGVTTTYLYDAQNLIREVSTVTTDYCFGPGIDEPLAMFRSGSVSYYNADGLGSISELNDAPGTVQNNYVLDGWGAVKSQTEAVANPFTYTARETAEATYMFYRARYLSPAIGRFISEDPIASDPDYGDFDRYNYVLNSPVIAKDPSGHYASASGFTIDPNCNCPIIKVNPNDPNEQVQDTIGRETDEWCKTKLPQITNPKRRKCVEKSCQKGKIKCERNCSPSEGGWQRTILFWGKRTAHFCLNTLPPLAAPGGIGDTIIHEWAHGCGWEDCGGEGVPDRHKCNGTTCADCK